METTGLEAFKTNKIRPTDAGLMDTKQTGKDCSMMLGICNPYRQELSSYLGYDITKFKDNIRFLEVVLNRHGQSNGICPLFFDGATCTFNELPLPTDKGNLEKVYEFIKNGCKQIQSYSHFMIDMYLNEKNNEKTKVKQFKQIIYGKCMHVIRKIRYWKKY